MPRQQKGPGVPLGDLRGVVTDAREAFHGTWNQILPLKRGTLDGVLVHCGTSMLMSMQTFSLPRAGLRAQSYADWACETSYV